MIANPKRRWFRFSLPTLFVLVTVIGIGAGWVAYQLNWIRQRHNFLNTGDIASEVPPPGFSDSAAIWPLSWFGETAPNLIFAAVAKMKRAQALFPEVTIKQMPDAGL